MSATLPDTPCYLNGDWGPLSQARVSVLDRGFIFGDGVYEVVPVYNGRLFRVEAHLARLDRSLSKVHIPNPHTPPQWLGLMRELVGRVQAHTGAADQLLYLQVTRGVAMRDHVMLPGLEPTVFMMSNPGKPPPAEQVHRGVAAVTARDFRWERGDIKATSLLGNVMARHIATERGAVETILLREGANGIAYVTEGASSNVWIAHEGALLGVPPSTHMLEGVRVELLESLCEEEGIAFNRRPLPESELHAADEVLISSAGRELLAVTRLDGEPVGHGALRGKPGPVFGRLFEAYQRAKIIQSI